MPRAEDVEVPTIQRAELRPIEAFDDREDRCVEHISIAAEAKPTSTYLHQNPP